MFNFWISVKNVLILTIYLWYFNCVNINDYDIGLLIIDFKNIEEKGTQNSEISSSLVVDQSEIFDLIKNKVLLGLENYVDLKNSPKLDEKL